MSIRARLVIGMVVLVSVGLAVANATGILLLRSYLLDRVDSQVAGFGPAEPPRPLGAVAPDPAQVCDNPRDPEGLRSDFVLLLLDAEGKVACSIGPELGADGPDLGRLPAARAVGGSLVTVPSSDGEDRWRVRVVDLEDGDGRVVFAVSLAEADATVGRLIGLSVSISGLVILITALAAWAIARLGLKPLGRIEEAAERIAGGELSARVPAYRDRTEVGRLAGALNGMLAQIERAFTERTRSEATLRQFISDASHELRTPVAAVRGHAEMWRTGVTDDLGTVMARIESESRRMGDLVDDMLLLARLDQARPLGREPVDLLVLAADAVLDTRALQPDRTITLAPYAGRHAPVVLGDASRLRQVLSNLLTNAILHTPASSPVEVSIGIAADAVQVVVQDAGPGMPPETAAKIFDRFYRADPGRVRDHGGSGLGLAIVRSLVEAHGGSVACQSSVAGGSRFLVALPRAGD